MVSILSIIFAITPVGGLCYKVNDSSILQDFFSSVLKFLSCYEKKKKKNPVEER